MRLRWLHSANAEFLTGLRGAYGFGALDAGLDGALAGWVRSGGDPAAAKTPAWQLQPSLHVILAFRADGIGADTYSKAIGTEEIYTVPVGPKLIITLQKSSGDDVRMPQIAVPLAPLLMRAAPALGLHVVYAHTFTPRDSIAVAGVGQRSGRSYIGITKRGWAARWGQHRHSASTGSPYRFHEAMRRYSDAISVHQVLACGLTYERAMALEERLVSDLSLYPNGLNMIPGGFAGYRYLAKFGFQASRKGWENREIIIRKFGADCSRLGRPNPLAAARWAQDDYAAAVICGNPNNFGVEEVREARYLESLGWGTSQLASRYGASEDRLTKLLAGQTYSRIH